MKKMHIQYELEQNIREVIKRQQMIRTGEKVLVALSGGADSVCLFRVLLALMGSLSFNFEVVHVNHMLRDTADRDEAFVRQLCGQFSVPFHCERVDVGRYAKEHRLGTEEAARSLRYALFEKISDRIGASRVALAHHEGDQAETILFHMCRGCGIDGLRGMAPVSGVYIRPLLGQSRDVIEEYLAALGQPYVTDETNFENIYSRNILRNRIMPVLTADICAKSQAHIAAVGKRMAELEEFVRFAVRQAYDGCVKDLEAGDTGGNRLVLDIPALGALHPYVQTELVRTCLYRLCRTKRDIAGVHVSDVLSLLHKQTGSSICLPYHMQARRSYGDIILERAYEDESDGVNEADARRNSAGKHEQREQVQQQVLLSGAEEPGYAQEFPMRDGRNLSVSIFSRPKDANIPTKACTKWFDYAKIEKPLVLRTPQEGDYFMLTDGHRKLLKDYMKNEKIPAEQRSLLPVIAMGNHVIYIVGGRISQAVKVSDGTCDIVQISIR